MIMIAVGILCAAYLVGGIPTGLLMGRLFGGIDVRRYGSGNLGATNVARVMGKLPGLVVLCVDAAKGWIPVTVFYSLWVASGMTEAAAFRILLGMLAVAGHIWNPFLQFRGGKGVATGLGVLLGLDLRVAGAVFFVWLAAVVLSRYVSVASVMAAMAAPFLMAFLGDPTSWVLGGVGIALAVIARHRENMLRLMQGEEHRLGGTSGRSA